jgi:hypothetical protein
VLAHPVSAHVTGRRAAWTENECVTLPIHREQYPTASPATLACFSRPSRRAEPMIGSSARFRLDSAVFAPKP